MTFGQTENRSLMQKFRATGLLCQGAVLNIARELIASRGRIARSEQALAELQTQLSQEKERNAACGKENCFGHKINGVQTWVTLQRLEREMSENARLTEALAASQARVGELEKALQEALMIIEVGLDTGTFELAGSLADIPARCRAALAAPDGQKEK